MKLTEEPEMVDWPETHYVYIEKVGPFMETAPSAWQSAHSLAPAIGEHNQITGYMSFYKRGPKVYRACFSLAAPPQRLPEAFEYEKFGGGKYSRFVLTGSFSELPAASGRVFEIVAEKGIKMREEFCIEHYVIDPRTTPEDQNRVEILIPTE
ncbi:MAG: GyrI-like domain-containing protein [Terracidiphilus sp.]